MLSKLTELYDGYLSCRGTWFDALLFLAAMITVHWFSLGCWCKCQDRTVASHERKTAFFFTLRLFASCHYDVLAYDTMQSGTCHTHMSELNTACVLITGIFFQNVDICLPDCVVAQPDKTKYEFSLFLKTFDFIASFIIYS